MKKVFFIVLILLIAGGVWYASHKSASPSVTVNNTTTTSAAHPTASNATFTFDGEPVTLKNGKATIPAGPDGITAEIDLTDVVGYGDLNGDGKEDAAVVFVQSGPGTGEFVSVAAYISGPVGYKGTNALFLGDRIEPTSISVKSGLITASYLDRRPDEPFSAEPTVKTTKSIRFDKTTGTIE